MMSRYMLGYRGGAGSIVIWQGLMVQALLEY